MGINSNGTIHNIMASGIFIQNGMIAESNCGTKILFNNHHKENCVFNSSQGESVMYSRSLLAILSSRKTEDY